MKLYKNMEMIDILRIETAEKSVLGLHKDLKLTRSLTFFNNSGKDSKSSIHLRLRDFKLERGGEKLEEVDGDPVFFIIIVCCSDFVLALSNFIFARVRYS